MLCFNSSMVRLGARIGSWFTEIILPFQFQHGAIGSVNSIIKTCYRRCVSIPAWCDWESEIIPLNVINSLSFNSSMVRLGVTPVPALKTIRVKFQFQHGAIGSFEDIETRKFSPLFQFQHGAIGSIFRFN